MFPLAFIEIAHTLSHRTKDVGETTTAKAITSLTTASIEKVTQHLLRQQEMTTDDIWWNNPRYIDNLAETSLTGEISISSTGSDSLENQLDENIAALDGFDTNSTLAYVPPQQRPETIFIIILFLIIFIVGVLGNGTLVIIFFKHSSMRNIPNTYTLSLAFADLLLIIVCVPLALLVYTTDSWTLGKPMCKLTEFSKDVSIGVSVFTLTALSGDRYCAIVNALKKLQTRSITIMMARLIWVFSMVLATPSLIMSDLQEIIIDDRTNLTIIICTPFGKQRNNSNTYAGGMVIAKAFIYYLVPLIIIAIFYLLTAKYLQKSAREMPGANTSLNSQARTRQYVAHMVVAFVGVFFICFFPYHLFELWFHLNPYALEDFNEFWHALRIVGFCTYFLNSCLNPVALYCVSRKFRWYFNLYLCCCFKTELTPIQQSTVAGVAETCTLNVSMRSPHHRNRASIHSHKAPQTGEGAHNSKRSNSVIQHQPNGTSVVAVSGKDVSAAADDADAEQTASAEQTAAIDAEQTVATNAEQTAATDADQTTETDAEQTATTVAAQTTATTAVQTVVILDDNR